MSELIRSRFKRFFGRTGARRAAQRLMACERLERRELFAVLWIGGSSGLWSTRTNWNTGNLPAAADDVEIASATVTVGAGTTAVAKSIKTGGSLVVDGTAASLNVTGNITQTGNRSLIVQNQGVLTADQVSTGGLLTVIKKSSLIANGVTAGGTVTVGNSLAGSGANVAYSELKVSGVLKTGGTLLLDDKAQITNATIDVGTTVRVIAGSSGNSFATAALMVNATVAGPVDMTTTQANLLVEQQLTLNTSVSLNTSGKIGFQGTQAKLLGTATISLGDQNANSINALTDFMTLTIGPGITIQGGNTKPIGLSGTSHIGGGGGNFTTLVLQGKVIVDAGMNMQVGQNVNDSGNRVVVEGNGSIEARGTLYLNGVFDGSGVGKVTRVGAGVIKLTGTINNIKNGIDIPAQDFATLWTMDSGAVNGGTIKQTANTGLQFTSSGGLLTNVRISGNTTLNPGVKFDVSGTLSYDQGTLSLFGGGIRFTGAEAAMRGNGKVVFVNGSTSKSYLAASDSGMTLTVGIDVLGGSTSTSSGAASIGDSGAALASSAVNTTLIIEGKITADQPGRTLLIAAPTSTVINRGTIEAKGGTIGLNGTFTRTNLGTIRNIGGIIQVLGTLDNRNDRLLFTPGEGPLTLVDGVILGGTIVQDALGIRFTSKGGTLDGVTVEGDIDLSADNQNVTARNGLTMSGTGKLKIGFGSFVTFLNSQTFDGNATVEFAGNDSQLRLDGLNTKLTIGPDVTIKAGVSTNTNFSSMSGIVDVSQRSSSVPNVVMNGSLISDKAGSGVRISLGSGLLTFNGQANSQNGEIRFPIGLQKVSWPMEASLTSTNTGTVRIGADFEFLATTADKVKLPGTTAFSGSIKANAPQLYDAPSRDFGARSEGFVESNFLMGTLRIDGVVSGDTVLRLIDNVPNAGNGSGKKDAVYVNTLILDANTTLDLGGINLYARRVIINGTGNNAGKAIDSSGLNRTVTIVKGGGTLTFSLPTPGTIDATQKTHEWTFFGRNGGRINLEVNPGSTGNSPAVAPLLNFARVTLKDPSGSTVTSIVNSSSGSLVALTNFELKSTGVYTVVVEALQANGSGNYVITAVDVTPNRRRVNVVVSSNQAQGADYGNAIEIVANVTPQAITVPNATGTVQFQLDGINFGSPVLLVNGIARLTLDRITAGARNITAIFISDNGIFDSLQTIFVQQVRKVVLTVSPRAIPARVAGTPIELLADMTGFIAGEGPSAVNGQVQLNVDAAALNKAGTYTIFASLGTLVATNYYFQLTSAAMVVLPSAPARLNIVSGGDQAIIINRRLPFAFRLKVLDEFSNVVPNASVSFNAPIGSGSFAGGLSTIAATTSNLGEVQAPAFNVSNQPGVYFITATCNGITTNFKVTIREAGLPLEFDPLDGFLREQDGKVTLTLRRNTVVTSPLTVTLTVNLPEFIGLTQTSIVFPVDNDEQTWQANIINDAIASTLIDGAAKQIEITASAPGLPSTKILLNILDDDMPTLTLQAPTAVDEGASKTLTIVRNTSVTGDLLVHLTSSDAQALNLPESIVIPASKSSVSLQIQASHDHLAFGPRAVNVSATAVGLNSATSQLSVTDIDTPQLTLQALGSINVQEGAAALFRIQRNTPADSALVVTLSSSLPSAVEMPTIITIEPGAMFAEFSVRAANDLLVSSNRTLTIGSVATGFAKVNVDLLIIEDDVPTLSLVLDNFELTEGSSASIFATLTRNTTLLPALNVTLDLQPIGRLIIPSVSFAAGSSAAFFSITAFDNKFFEGLQSVRLTASDTNFVGANANVQIVDNEKLTLTPKGQRTLSEKDGILTFTVTRDVTNVDEPLVVNLLSSDTSELTMPPTVIIPGGSASVDFDISSVLDKVLDGTQSVQIAASASAYVSANDTVSVTDVESIGVQLDTSSISEQGGTITVTVTRSDINDLSQELQISVTNSDTARLTFPTSVRIPAGQESITVEGTAQDNSVASGDRQVTLKFTAAGYTEAQASVQILEDDKLWHNTHLSEDVNHDGKVTAIDALLIINWLNTRTKDLPPTNNDGFFVDTNDDSLVTALDALLVINYLNNPPPTGEGETSIDHVATVDSLFADGDWEQSKRKARGQ